MLLFCYFVHILFSSQMRPALCLAFINFCHLGAGFASAEVEPQQKYKFVKKVKLRKYKFANGKNLHLDVGI